MILRVEDGGPRSLHGAPPERGPAAERIEDEDRGGRKGRAGGPRPESAPVRRSRGSAAVNAAVPATSAAKTSAFVRKQNPVARPAAQKARTPPRGPPARSRASSARQSTGRPPRRISASHAADRGLSPGREDLREPLDDLRARVLVVRRRVERREVERRVQRQVAFPEDLSRELLVEEELAEAVHAHGDGDGLRAVEELGDAGAQRRALLRRAGGKVEEPAVRDRLLHLRDALEVDRRASPPCRPRGSCGGT